MSFKDVKILAFMLYKNKEQAGSGAWASNSFPIDRVYPCGRF